MSKWKLAEQESLPGCKSLGQGKKEGCRRGWHSDILPSLVGLKQHLVCLSSFTEPWGGVGRVPGARCFTGALAVLIGLPCRSAGCVQLLPCSPGAVL